MDMLKLMLEKQLQENEPERTACSIKYIWNTKIERNPQNNSQGIKTE